MGNISLEQIDLIMKRAKVSYTEAKEALEKCNGDVVEALVYLEKENKVKQPTSASSASESVKSFISKLNATKFILSKNEQTYINSPLSIAILALIFCFPFTVTALIIAILCGMKVDIKGENDLAKKVNDTIDSLKK